MFDPANNHIYEYVNSVTSWTDAFNNSAAKSLAGDSGYLVTITSADEQNFVVSNALSRISVGYGFASVWIAASDSATLYSWYWMAGPETGTQFWQGAGPNGIYGPPGNAVDGAYSNWRGGRYDAPNQVGGDGQFSPAIYAHMLLSDLGGNFPVGVWEDDINTYAAYGPGRPGGNAYVIEYSGTASVPEPTTLVLLTVGLAGLGFRRRRHA